MVAMRQGQEFTYVAPPRYSPDAAFKYRGRFEDVKATAMQKAVEGQRGYGEGVDYQGHPVVAAWSYLPSYRWGMVVKQDVDEAFGRQPGANHGSLVTGGDELAGDCDCAGCRGQLLSRSGRLPR